ncbi:hypothetical protein B0H66DRAFT_66326 [Apodospora peruviana]|uniref:Uncharacterized protein n=1 Tax=Apodospora peruviana TaxID=516989 RepID=A0AAE0MG64_9PEZI|nr:hypothetical protein B0H66DRAFT_66326 [Apodospora peruviana]
MHPFEQTEQSGKLSVHSLPTPPFSLRVCAASVVAGRRTPAERMAINLGPRASQKCNVACPFPSPLFPRIHVHFSEHAEVSKSRTCQTIATAGDVVWRYQRMSDRRYRKRCLPRSPRSSHPGSSAGGMTPASRCSRPLPPCHLIGNRPTSQPSIQFRQVSDSWGCIFRDSQCCHQTPPPLFSLPLCSSVQSSQPSNGPQHASLCSCLLCHRPRSQLSEFVARWGLELVGLGGVHFARPENP